MNKFITRFLKDESGATAIEYGLIAAGIAVVIIAAVTAVGSNLSTKLSAAASAIGTRNRSYRRFRVEGFGQFDFQSEVFGKRRPPLWAAVVF